MATRVFYLQESDLRKLRGLITSVESQKNFGGGSLFGMRSTSRGRQPPPEGMRIGKVAGVSAAEGTTAEVTYDIETYNGGTMGALGVGLTPWLRAVPASDTQTVLTAAEVGALCVYWVGEMVEDPEPGREVHLICVQGEGLAVGDCAGARSSGKTFDWVALDALTTRLRQMEQRLERFERNAAAASLTGGA